jgi:hypothetical protein
MELQTLPLIVGNLGFEVLDEAEMAGTTGGDDTGR